MASTYSNIKIQLMATGENTTTWGDVTNVNLGTALEEAIVGSADVAFSNTDVTLTLSNTNSTQSARNMRLNLTGTATSGYNLVVPAIEKPYIVNNGTDGTITVKNSTGAGVAVPAGKTMWVYNNGTNVVDVVTHVTSLTLAGTLSTGGNLTVGGGGDLLLSSASGGNNTALYNDAQDLNINVNSAIRMYVSSAGLVGVGSTTPKTRLQATAGGFLNAPVLGNATGAPLYVSNADSSYGLVVGVSSADGRAWFQGQRTDGSAIATNITLNEGGGNVGIGTASLQQTAAGRTVLGVNGTSSSLINLGSAGNFGTYWFWDGTTATFAANNTLSLLAGNSPILFSNSAVERMRITDTGTVGVGTSTVAGGRMQINGQVSDTDGTGFDQGQLLLTDSDNNTTSGLMLGYRFQSGVAEYGRIQARNVLGATNLVLQRGGGNVGIGTASPTEKLNVAGNILAAGNITATGNIAAAGNLTAAGNITATGDITATGNVTAYSDARLKTDLQKIEGALDKVEKLTGYTFTRIDSGECQTGLIAQDVQAVLPEAVSEGEYLAVAYGNMMGLVVEAIKELRAEVAELRQQAVKVVKP